MEGETGAAAGAVGSEEMMMLGEAEAGQDKDDGADEEPVLGLCAEEIRGCCKVLDLFLQDADAAKRAPQLKPVRVKLFAILKKQKKQFFHGRSEVRPCRQLVSAAR
eukprot:scaffold1248_cov393-Prasinococcus_capsulatus_cf.AAC.10